MFLYWNKQTDSLGIMIIIKNMQKCAAVKHRGMGGDRSSAGVLLCLDIGDGGFGSGWVAGRPSVDLTPCSDWDL